MYRFPHIAVYPYCDFRMWVIYVDTCLIAYVPQSLPLRNDHRGLRLSDKAVTYILYIKSFNFKAFKIAKGSFFTMTRIISVSLSCEV